jgi:hypothetical protein
MRTESSGFASPEDAAKAGWQRTEGVAVRVLSVEIRGDRAEVVIEVNPSYSDYVYCYRAADRWHEAVSGGGPSDRWDDPTYLIWPDSPGWLDTT